MMSYATSIHSEANSITEIIPANSYLFLIQISMFSCVAWIHSATNSITKWTSANNYLFLIQFSILSRLGNIHFEMNSITEWTCLHNYSSPILSSMLTYVIRIHFQVFQLVTGLIIRRSRVWDGHHHCHILQGIHSEINSIPVSTSLGDNNYSWSLISLMLPCSTWIHFEVNSIVEWTSADNYFFPMLLAILI